MLSLSMSVVLTSQMPGLYARRQLIRPVLVGWCAAARFSVNVDGEYAHGIQHFLYFFPLPHGHGSLRPTLGAARKGSVIPMISSSSLNNSWVKRSWLCQKGQCGQTPARG